MTQQNTLSVEPVSHDFHQNLKNTLKKLALDYTTHGTLEELALLIGVHATTVLTWCSIGNVPPKKARFIETIFGQDVVKAATLSRDLANASTQPSA